MGAPVFKSIRQAMRNASTVALLLTAATPCGAQVANPVSMTTDPGDLAVMSEVASAVASRKPDMARLDAALAKLPRPTPLRGMVQTVRAGVLANAKDPAPAVAAIEEALRLLPNDPRPKLVATGIFTFSGSPQRAADLWMLASRESPDFARMSDRYSMMALIGRLTDVGDRVRADRLRARLDEIGFSAGLAAERSAGALARTRVAVRGQRESEALLSVTAISDPDDLLSLFIDQSYAMLWPRITEWAGPDLAAQSRRYLEELRGEWAAADNFDTATAYARELAKLEAYAAVEALFLPMFDRVRPGAELEGVEFLAPIVARSLAVLGRGAEARALLAKVAGAMPTDSGANALNIDGAYVTLAAIKVDWPEVIVRADTFLARAQNLGSDVNTSAVIQTKAWQACALWRTGRTAEAQQISAEVSLAEAVAPNSVMNMILCRGNSVAARALIIARLADETTRDWALRFVQPVPAPLSTPLALLTHPVAQATRTAPDVVAAVKRSGRILTRPVNAKLPKGFDPFRAQPTSTPAGPDTI